MEAKELRIGNYLHSIVSNCNHKKGLVEIEIETFAKIRLQNALQSLEPIPLTEEWLVKFGFKRSSSKTTRLGQLKYNTFDLKGGSGYVNAFSYGSIIFTHINYVHQLQNLYYALTQTELEVK